MKEELKQRFLQEVLPYLSAEDDTSFWIRAFDTLLSDIEARYPEKSKKQEIFLSEASDPHLALFCRKHTILPDNETKVDLLNNEAIAKTIVKLLRKRPNHHITIAVYGDWGPENRAFWR